MPHVKLTQAHLKPMWLVGAPIPATSERLFEDLEFWEVRKGTDPPPLAPPRPW